MSKSNDTHNTLEVAIDFLIGGLAGAAASLVTNPLDVVRTRLVLQGELGKRGTYYKNVFHAMYTIVKSDGVRALQQGVVPSMMFQLVANSVRLGVYSQADKAGLLRDESNMTKFWNSLLVGAMAGATGAGLGSPLLLVKTQLMSSSHKDIAVGTQHGHTGTWAALSKIYRSGGVRGLWRGTVATAMRNAVGSSMQIASYAVVNEAFPVIEKFDVTMYDSSKDAMDASPWFKHSNKYWSSFFASNIAAVAKTVAMNPLDVIVTRVYNQPVDKSGKGRLYGGLFDCTRKIASTEGLFAFYKGIAPSYYRQVPQSVLLLMFWDVLKNLQNSLMGRTDEVR